MNPPIKIFTALYEDELQALNKLFLELDYTEKNRVLKRALGAILKPDASYVQLQAYYALKETTH